MKLGNPQLGASAPNQVCAAAALRSKRAKAQAAELLLYVEQALRQALPASMKSLLHSRNGACPLPPVPASGT